MTIKRIGLVALFLFGMVLAMLSWILGFGQIDEESAVALNAFMDSVIKDLQAS